MSMSTTLEIIFWLSIFCLLYVYQGYLWVLRLVALIVERKPAQALPPAVEEWPSVTVLLTVHNEENKIGDRLRDILECDYPPDKLEILVASDGSTDGTAGVVKRWEGKAAVRMYEGERAGKTETQNQAIRLTTGQIILFTDVDTKFDVDFLRAMARAFLDEKVGLAVAKLLFLSSGNSISRSQGFYWNYETKLREEESRLGILAVASGQCMAVRAGLLRPMEPFVGEDCIVPLDVVLQGFKCVQVEAALAYDVMESQPEKEFRTRVRMTLRNWVGTWLRPDLLNLFRHPGYAFALWSHKLLRWLSPLFLICATVSVLLLAVEPLYSVLAILAGGFYLAALIGGVGEKSGRKIPLVSAAYGFLVANLGFMIGLFKAWTGHRIVTYRSGMLEKQTRGE